MNRTIVWGALALAGGVPALCRDRSAGCSPHPARGNDEAAKRRADLYLLMDTDLAWQPDAARDSGGDTREDLFDAFRCALEELGARWVIVSGVGEGRWEAVRANTNFERSEEST